MGFNDEILGFPFSTCRYSASFGKRYDNFSLYIHCDLFCYLIFSSINIKDTYKLYSVCEINKIVLIYETFQMIFLLPTMVFCIFVPKMDKKK